MGTELEEWETKLRGIFQEIDNYLEDEYGSLFPLHPSRPARGRTSNPEYDGLFDVGASYTAGFGSKFGEGYEVQIRWATLKKVDDGTQDEIEEKVVEFLNKRLSEVFPGMNLKAVHDGHILKIVGNLKLTGS